jgi:hypothetical protein
MTKDDQRFFTWLIMMLLLWGFTNELWKSVEMARFHNANNLQLEYNKATEEKLIELKNILEIAVDPE